MTVPARPFVKKPEIFLGNDGYAMSTVGGNLAYDFAIRRVDHLDFVGVSNE